jgi:nitroimidazol reductase NimA-like FMN-containing flavoprotein (pyridoxamine 5'-phosphate oxidase superfamily)
MTTKMSRDEREAFLADVHVGVISISEKGRGPLTIPVWYAYEPGGEVSIATERNSRKMQLLEEGRRVSFCVQCETPPYKYVSVEGPVVDIDASDVERDERPLAHRYLGEKRGDQYIEASTDGREPEDMVRVRIRPERWLTVDYSKEDIGL